MIKDVIYKPSCDEDVVQAQEIGFKNGYSWDLRDEVKNINILFNDTDRCHYLLFTNYLGYDVNRERKTIYRYSSHYREIDEIIHELKSEVENYDYEYITDLTDLNFYLKYRRKNINYNEPRKLVYENKIIKFNNFKNV